MLLASLTHQAVQMHFSPGDYEKGKYYFLRGHVSHIEIMNERDVCNIKAKVQGTRSKPYDVHVEVHHNREGIRIKGLCSCPVAISCKHIAAVLLKARTQPVSIHNTNSSVTVLPKTTHNSEIDAWLRKLKQTVNPGPKPEPKVDESSSLLYLLDELPHGNNGLEVKLVLSRRLKFGGLGASKPYSHTSISQSRHLYPIDKELIVKMEVLQKSLAPISNYNSSWRNFYLKGEAGEKLIAELITTGRCHWRVPTNDALRSALPKAAKLDWSIDTDGNQELRFANMDPTILLFSLEQFWYLNTATWQLGLLETGLEREIVELLLATPKIPPEQTQAVHDLLTTDERFITVSKPKIFTEPKFETIKPIPCLRLSRQTMRIPDRRGSWWDTQAPKSLAELSFDYCHAVVPWEDKTEIFQRIEKDQLIKFVRDKQAETDAIDELVEYGLILVDAVPELNKANPQYGRYFLLDDIASDALDFSLLALPNLRANGWRIEMDEDYPYQVVQDPIEDWYSSIDEGSSYDWFSLELGIIIKGEKINLLPILQQLLQKMSANKQTEITDIKPVAVQLPDGRYLSLPSDRVRNIVNVLLELHDQDSLIDDKLLRLSKLHATRLLELEAAMGAAQLRWFGGEKLRKFAEKLLDFKGIKSVKAPKQFKGQLRPYQAEGLSWLQFLREYELGGILADDMGLGKTIQALAYLIAEKMSGRMKMPSLVVAPTSLMFNWQSEAKQFVPNLKVLLLHGNERKQHFENIHEYDLVLTTYPLLVRDKAILLKQEFYLLILDEAQFIKNCKSLATQIVQQIKTKHRLCLTGTPLENHLGELWSLFHFLMPGLLGDEKKFNRLFRGPIEKMGSQERQNQLNRRIAPFLLRRTKNKVIKELPEKVEIIRHVELEGVQRDLYEAIRITMQQKIRKEIARMGLARSHIIILDALLKLRQVCCDPRLLKVKTTKKAKSKSAKLSLFFELVEKLLEEGRSILLFSQFTEMLGLIEEELHKQKIPYVKLTGQTKDRATPVQQFQQGKVRLFLISLKAGGVGLNLTAADTVIHYDPWWNPAVENQATDRAHRIGQNKTVFVYKFIAKGTLEEKILEMQQHKRALMDGLFAENTASKLKLTEKDLQQLFEPLEAVI